MVFIVLLFIRAPFYVLLVFVCICSVFWLFWLICQYLPSDWLERLLWGSLTMARGLSPQCPGWRLLWSSWFIVLFHCSIVWLSCPPAVRYMLHTPVAWYSLFVLKVLLNNNKPNHFAILLAKHRHILPHLSQSHHCSCPPPISEMTYTVPSGTLNSTIPYPLSQLYVECRVANFKFSGLVSEVA